MLPGRAPMWLLATASSIVLLVVSAPPLLGGGRGSALGGEQNPPLSAATPDTCAACHGRLHDQRLSAPVALFSDDIHREKGFGCAACHGGDASREGLDAMDPRRGYIGKPSHERIPQMCARCHADAELMRRYNPAIRVDQFAEYQTSVHGRRLAEHHDGKVATCASCHSPHSIRPASDPQSTVNPTRVVDTCGGCHADAAYMAPYGIPMDQLALYKKSVHWHTITEAGDLSAPTCNDCHGNHGAVPPGLDSVGNVCGQCHAVQGELFRASRHAGIFKDIGTPGCVTCHSNHDVQRATDALLGVGEGAACAACHSADDAPGRTAMEMRTLIDTLRSEHERAHSLLMRAERSGIEVSQAQFDLNNAVDALVKARAAVHSFTVAAVSSPVGEGRAIAARAHARAVRAQEELRFRRRGLAVSVLIILTLIAALAMKIRQIERPGGPAGPGPLSGDRHAP
jgi:hypothetical protein